MTLINKLIEGIIFIFALPFVACITIFVWFGVRLENAFDKAQELILRRLP